MAIFGLSEKQAQKHRSRQRFAYAVKTGKISCPNKCSKCETVCKPEGHHDDYSRALEVRWLCRKCHMHLHTINGGMLRWRYA